MAGHRHLKVPYWRQLYYHQSCILVWLEMSQPDGMSIPWDWLFPAPFSLWFGSLGGVHYFVADMVHCYSGCGFQPLGGVMTYPLLDMASGMLLL